MREVAEDWVGKDLEDVGGEAERGEEEGGGAGGGGDDEDLEEEERGMEKSSRSRGPFVGGPLHRKKIAIPKGDEGAACKFPLLSGRPLQEGQWLSATSAKSPSQRAMEN